MRLLLIALCLSLVSAHGGDLSLSCRTPLDSKVKIQITSWLRQRPSVGFMPLRVTIQNGTTSAGTILLSRTDRRGGRSIFFSQEFSVPASNERSFEVMLPIGAGGTGGYYDTITISGMGINSEVNLPIDTSGGAVEPYSRYLAVSDSLHIRSWNGISSGLSSENQEVIGCAVDPMTAPTDWRGYTGLAQWWMTGEEWQKIPKASKSALLEWVALGGEIMMICTKVDAASLEALALPGGSRLVQLYGKGRIDVAEAAKNGGVPNEAISFQRQRSGKLNIEKSVNTHKIGKWMNEIVGILQMRGWLIFLFIIAFAVVVGPVNLFVLAGKGRRARLFWTTPLISLIGSLLLALIILFEDGTGGVGAQLIHVTLMPDEKKIAITQEQTSRTGLLLSSNFAIAEPSLMQPMASKFVEDYRRSPYDRSGSENWSCTPESRFGDWFRSRSVQSHLLQAVRPSRAAIELTTGSTPHVVSTIDAELKVLYLIDDADKVWKAEAVATGEKHDLQPSSIQELRDWLTQIRSDVAPGTIVSKGLTDELPRSGSIYAEAADGAGFAISTLSSIHWKQRKAFITGPYVTR